MVEEERSRGECCDDEARKKGTFARRDSPTGTGGTYHGDIISWSEGGDENDSWHAAIPVSPALGRSVLFGLHRLYQINREHEYLGTFNPTSCPFGHRRRE